jgi:hypothetical protein
MTKAYTVRIIRERDVEVVGESWIEAQQTVRELYESGDSCAELEDATYGVLSIRELDD